MPTSSGSPMTPVDEMKTSSGAQPTALAAASAVSRTASSPRFPVKALALPELTTRARARPCLSCSAHHSTDAERVFDCVEDAGDDGAGIEDREQQVRRGPGSGCPLQRSRSARREPPAWRVAISGRMGRRGEVYPSSGSVMSLMSRVPAASIPAQCRDGSSALACDYFFSSAAGAVPALPSPADLASSAFFNSSICLIICCCWISERACSARTCFLMSSSR